MKFEQNELKTVKLIVCEGLKGFTMKPYNLLIVQSKCKILVFQ